jgi:hypothetical protein
MMLGISAHRDPACVVPFRRTERAGRERAMAVGTREAWKREEGEIGRDWEGDGGKSRAWENPVP